MSTLMNQKERKINELSSNYLKNKGETRQFDEDPELLNFR